MDNEDIKILEEFKKSIKNFNNYADNTNVSLITKRQVKAIQNLIARYKKLEEENKELKSDNYELNNRINDLLDLVKQKEKMIDLLVRELYKKAHISTKCYLMTSVEECMKHKNCHECLKKYFEERCK